MNANDDIRKMRPCYDPSRYLPEDWQGDAVTILEHPDIPELDKIWVVRNWLPERTLRLFAVWCARQALSLVANPDPRSVAACDVAEQFAATKADLQTAREAAYAAAGDNRDDFLPQAIGELHHLAKKELNRRKRFKTTTNSDCGVALPGNYPDNFSYEKTSKLCTRLQH